MRTESFSYSQHQQPNPAMFSSEKYYSSSGYSSGSEDEYYSDGEYRTRNTLLITSVTREITDNIH